MANLKLSVKEKNKDMMEKLMKMRKKAGKGERERRERESEQMVKEIINTSNHLQKQNQLVALHQCVVCSFGRCLEKP